MVGIVLASCGGTQATGGPATNPTAAPSQAATSGTQAGGTGRTVFVIVMENHNWSQIAGNPSAPYINGTLLPMGARAEQYYNPPGAHPSEPNYLWLEAGSSFGIADDAPPEANHQATRLHLVTLLEKAGISWKAYQEGIRGTGCPLTSEGLYAPKHNPMVYFDDVTNTNDVGAARCIAHVRPFSELSGDIQQNRVARYSFITPNLCNDMHNACAPDYDAVKQGDRWLAENVPAILQSRAYQDGGIVFITWDEGEGGDGPIGLIALSRDAKAGYANRLHYTHSSLLRTVEEIFGVGPLLGDAANARDLRDVFRVFP